MTIDTKVMKEAAEETIGYRKSTNTEWISSDTLKTIEERRQIRKNYFTSYHQG
jgi:hypothetical protein